MGTPFRNFSLKKHYEVKKGVKLSLRDVWPNEALDFTPWLLKTHIIEDIMSSLHIYNNPLKFWKSEVTCGEYRIDMIYKEVNGDSGRLIVENQYERSDSKHLGQILVYSKLTGIKYILWISEGVGKEHQGISEMLKDVRIIPVSFNLHKISHGYILNVYIYYGNCEVLSYQ